ncbi:MAG: deoxynucleoside kinase [Bacteroidota bacterium]|nr:deoxynucleoside kinase [Bacteroidota bacterium]
MKNKFIIIEGNIGAGKTSFVQKFCKLKNYKGVYEHFENNPFLPKFYEDPEKYAFTVEMSFLADRYHQLNKEIHQQDMFTDGIASDYYLVKSLIFARSTLSSQEFDLYRNIFNIIYQRLPSPDIYVYLHKSPEKLLSNIHERGRDYEKNISADYLKSIENSYFTFFKQHPQIPVLVINTEDLDFVKSDDDFFKIVNQIEIKLKNEQ